MILLEKSIVLKDGKQITEFQNGILPAGHLKSTALVFDNSAGRPDVMFVKVLETDGKFTLLDKNTVIRQTLILGYLQPLTQ